MNSPHHSAENWPPPLDLSVDSKRFGNHYGGWNVLSEYINEHSLIYSAGVGEDASFDLELIDEKNCTIHAFDPTPRAIDWVKKNISSDHFKMHAFGLGASNRIATFSAPENPEYVSQTILKDVFKNTKKIDVQLHRLKTIMDKLGHSHIDILKMDIEGAEYEVIKDLADTDIRPKQILVEFHHRFDPLSVEDSVEAVATLRSIDYKTFWRSKSGYEIGLVHQPQEEA
ncbi:FkbM family methyltransferase [Pelagicoccus sp. SDUM812003]|uniref:FkbM family methyltransferase n=1 Tax=Pelagicoccus sp. SDUM812003 TaxID=3041267 RepID=UPI0028103F23|nr:FkbM family methyltransferase [Pelagicoccus sp. SDUM812003]MDQ8201575.1 FkbM family methyltransferase [Pelagicoccus sp. SDUM812003]